MRSASTEQCHPLAGFAAVLLVWGLFVLGCNEPETRQQQERRVEPSAAPPSESRPIPQGFTHRPPPNTPGLPPPIAPFLSDSEREALASKRAGVTSEAEFGAQEELLGLVQQFESSSSSSLVSRLRDRVHEHAREGRLRQLSADELYRAYLFPNDVGRANAEFQGKLVVLTGTVAPHNMTDLADGFKLFEQTPYVQEPVLLATHQELAFVRCRLAEPQLQKLRDWQEIHVLGVVTGKDRGDVVMDRCVVL